MNEQKPPVNEGEEFNVRVEAVGEKGDGIVRVKGFVLFVPGVKEGQNIRIKVNKILSKVGFAEKIETIEKSEVQVEVEQEIPEIKDAPAPEDSEDFGEEPEEKTETVENIVEEEKTESNEAIELPKDE